ncbi:uncharacterized protein LOC117168876 isoform X1 [Belonocnema kinseyi]|uniref:uncharacterized protein LOC117168876 isoform X1 n=1 Tax=Belonocnema kinseyi TaxID=2817044 RepID=UPI00143D7848|nr:uncharacterized protein LOC117168876 isoform X1 [Belonocnema kinseyi]
MCDEKFALLIECGTQKTHKVPLSAVHPTLQAYKFNNKENEVSYGTISFIANTAEEVDQVLEAGRLRKPPKRLVEPALETTDKIVEIQTRRKPVQHPKRKVEDILNSRLSNLKKQQSEKRQHVTPQIHKTSAFQMELSGGDMNHLNINNDNVMDQLPNQLSKSKNIGGTSNGMTHQENAKIKSLSIFKNCAAVRPPQAVKPHSTVTSPATIKTSVRGNINLKTNANTSETVHSQPPTSVYRNNAFADSMMKKNALDNLEFQKKSVEVNDFPTVLSKKVSR